MTLAEKEHLLHKVVASSAFVFALLILPVAQYVLVDSQQPGDVAGVEATATPETEVTRTVHAEVPNLSCSEGKEKELTDFDRFESGKKIALTREYTDKVAGYKAAQSALTGDEQTIAQERAALDVLIDAEYQPYLAKVAQLEDAVNAQRQLVESRSCGSN